MTFPADDKPRVSRGKYWLMFALNCVAVLLLAFVGVAAAMNGEWATAIVLFLLILPVGIYFRVVMMRRCRDIGWPPSLPWIMFALSILASLFNFADAGKGAMPTGMGFSGLISLVDFVLMIVIGCIKGRAQVDYQQVFGDDSAVPVRAAPLRDRDFATAPATATDADLGGDAMDDAIARALENYRRTGSAVPDGAQPMPALVKAMPSAAARPAPRQAGFGRKLV